MANEQIVNKPNLYVDGLQIARTGDATLTIEAGACRDENNKIDIVVASQLTCDMGSVGANGIDAGAAANSTVYYVYVIGDETKYNDPASLISSSSSPVMPAGYNIKRLVGYMVTDGSADLLAGYWYGDRNERVWKYDAPIITAVSAGASATYAAVALTNFVPPIENLPVMIAYRYTNNAASDVFAMTPGNGTGDAVRVVGQVAGVVMEDNVEVMSKVTSSVPEIDYKVSDGAVAIYVAGYRLSL